jgi:ADP-ribose pyrophosphatase
MKKLVKTNEERVFKTPRMEGVKVSYADDQGNHVLTHTIIKSNPSVAIVVRKNGQIALIQQFRSTTGQNYIEIPAGVINDGESEEAAAIRETREETGLLVKDAYSLVKGPSLLDPSKSDENYGVAVAEVYGQKAQCLDEMEQIDSEILWMDEKEVFARVRAQMFKGEPFMDDLFMSGHSMYALMAYRMSK